MIEGFKQPCNLFLKKNDADFSRTSDTAKRGPCLFFLLSWCLYHWVFSRSEGQIPPHNLEAGGSENPAQALHQKSMATPRKTGANPLWLRFSPLNHSTKPLPKKKRGSAFHSHFSQPKKYRLTTYHFNHPFPLDPSLPLVQIWSPAPRAWYVLCCKPRKMPLWTLQNGQSRPPIENTSEANGVCLI